jgi:carboxypeptidase Taq
MDMTSRLQQLRTQAARIADLTGTASLLSWDQETLMPRGGTESRAHQLGTLAALVHQHYTDPKLGDLLRELRDGLPPLGDDLPPGGAASDDALIVRAMLHQHEQRIRVPSELVVKRSELSTRSREAWKAARAANEFSQFAPFLSDQFALSKELAGHLGFDRNPYDALLDQFEPGLSFEWVDTRFQAVKPELQSLIRRIAEAQASDPSHAEAAKAVHREVSPERQLDFSRSMAEALGFDFLRGRMDRSAHPFTSGASSMDVRFTTRVLENYFPSCLFAVIHEAGHGMHGQNLRPELYRFPFRYGLALAESQSRFYENIIGRSRLYWNSHYGNLQKAVPEYADVPAETWYRAINAVHPSLIRVEADEVTYGMHIMLRFEIENAAVNGELQVEDFPAAWNDAMERYLGVRPESDANGVLQDIHWSIGAIGYFPDYLLGSMLSSQLWEAVRRAIPTAADQVSRGELAEINQWMATTVQGEGGKFTFAEMAKHATGTEFSSEPYMNYLNRKYGEIYRLR